MGNDMGTPTWSARFGIHSTLGLHDSVPTRLYGAAKWRRDSIPMEVRGTLVWTPSLCKSMYAKSALPGGADTLRVV